MEYIYLIRTREFIRLNEPTYKIGKTKQLPNNRLSGYPKGSEVILFITVENCDMVEDKLIKKFLKKFTQRSEYGREYFTGEISLMCKIIYSFVSKIEEYLYEYKIKDYFYSILNKDIEKRSCNYLDIYYYAKGSTNYNKKNIKLISKNAEFIELVLRFIFRIDEWRIENIDFTQIDENFHDKKITFISNWYDPDRPLFDIEFILEITKYFCKNFETKLPTDIDCWNSYNICYKFMKFINGYLSNFDDYIIPFGNELIFNHIS